MQSAMQRPDRPDFIAYPNTPQEMWWDPSTENWVKAPTAPMPANLGKIVQAYSAIRDARTAKRRDYEAADLALEEDQHKLKVIMLALLNANGARSINTDHGTVYRTEKIKPSAADWTAIYDWIGDDLTGARFELLEKRLKSTFVKDFMEQNAGAIPPGINVHREFEVAVRRPNTATSTDTTNQGNDT